MDFLPSCDFPVWKSELLDGKADQVFGAEVGSCLGTIHRRSAGDPDLAQRFAHDATFEAIRIEPYLHAAGRAHPELQPWLADVAARTMANKRALVHGDVSPKNILHGSRGPVFLDAECAWYGDPAFDLAFCLNHLLLKGAHRPERRQAFLGVFMALTQAYLDQVEWEPAAELERRCAALLPALLLARVDGKSPVEYLDDSRRDSVRRASVALIRSRPETLSTIVHAWNKIDA